MKTIFIAAWILMVIVGTTWSQDKLLRIEESVAGLDYKLRPANLRNLNWRGSSDYYVYQVNGKIYQKQVGRTDSMVLLDVEILNGILEEAGQSAIRLIPSVTWINSNEIMIRNQQHIVLLDIEKMKIIRTIELEKDAADIAISPDFKSVAYTRGTNLYYSGTENIPVQVNDDTTQGIWNGSGNVHRHEFGISQGIFWSPIGNYLAYYRKDETMVKDYPMVDVTGRMAELKTIKYPMAGMTSEEVELVVYDIKNKSSVTLNTGKFTDPYLTSVTWGPDEEFVYIGLLNRDQDHLKLARFLAETGEFKDILFEEKHPSYVEPELPALVFFGPPGA